LISAADLCSQGSGSGATADAVNFGSSTDWQIKYSNYGNRQSCHIIWRRNDKSQYRTSVSYLDQAGIVKPRK